MRDELKEATWGAGVGSGNPIQDKVFEAVGANATWDDKLVSSSREWGASNIENVGSYHNGILDTTMHIQFQWNVGGSGINFGWPTFRESFHTYEWVLAPASNHAMYGEGATSATLQSHGPGLQFGEDYWGYGWNQNNPGTYAWTKPHGIGGSGGDTMVFDGATYYRSALDNVDIQIDQNGGNGGTVTTGDILVHIHDRFVNAQVTPEPSSAASLMAGFGCLAIARRRKRV
jgi:hypothetical protein